MTTYLTRYVSKSSYADSAGGSGRLYALLISHDQSSVQTVTLYDNTAASGTVLAAIHIAPEQSPALLDFSAILGGKKSGLPFSVGLSIAAGGHAEVTTWELRY